MYLCTVFNLTRVYFISMNKLWFVSLHNLTKSAGYSYGYNIQQVSVLYPQTQTKSRVRSTGLEKQTVNDNDRKGCTKNGKWIEPTPLQEKMVHPPRVRLHVHVHCTRQDNLKGQSHQNRHTVTRPRILDYYWSRLLAISSRPLFFPVPFRGKLLTYVSLTT